MTNIIYDTSQDADFEKMFDMSIHTGIIREIYPEDDTARVDIADLGGEFDHVDIFYHCPNSGDILGGSAAFSIDDEVVVVNEKGRCAPDVADLKIIGFADKELRFCSEYLVIGLASTSVPYDKIILWDIAANAYATGVKGDDGNVITAWPADTDNLNDWFAIHDIVYADEVYKNTHLDFPQPEHVWDNVSGNSQLWHPALTDGVPLDYSKSLSDPCSLPGHEDCYDTSISNQYVLQDLHKPDPEDSKTWYRLRSGSGSSSCHRCATLRGMYILYDSLGYREDFTTIFGSKRCDFVVWPDIIERNSFFTKTEIIDEQSTYYHKYMIYGYGTPDWIGGKWIHYHVSGLIKFTTETPYGILFSKSFPYSCDKTDAGVFSISMGYFATGGNLVDSGRTKRSLAGIFFTIYTPATSTYNGEGDGIVSLPMTEWAGPLCDPGFSQEYEKPTFALHAVCAPDEDPEHKNPFDLSRNTQLETAIGALVQQFIDQAYAAGEYEGGSAPSISFTYDFRR